MMKNNDWIEIELYYDDHCYETEGITISVSPERVYLKEYTSEHAPGRYYSLTHILDSENARKFIACISAEGRDLVETVKAKFSGADGAEKFMAYCKAHIIEYHSHI